MGAHVKSGVMASAWAVALVAPMVLVALVSPAALANTGGVLYSWGSEGTGQLGNGTADNSNVPVTVSLPQGVTATEISGGAEWAYAVGSDGNVYAWGYGADGELGDGSTASSDTPVQVSLPDGVVATAVSGGSAGGMALASDGSVYAWGYGLGGQLGDGTTPSAQVTPVPVDLPAGITATAIASGGSTNYALGSDGNIYAWGNGHFGELGDSNQSNSSLPVVVPLPAGVTATAIAAGLNDGYAIGSDGLAYSWGYDGDYELGYSAGPVNFVPTPEAVATPVGVTVIAITSLEATGYALASDGTVYAWGHANEGQIGDGTNPDAVQTPTAVSLPSPATAIAAFGGGGYALGQDGTVYGWGADASDELGTGASPPQTCEFAVPCSTNPLPVDFPPGVSAIAINGGGNDGYAITSGSPVVTAPDAPVAVSVAAGNGQATVTWSPPTSNGNSPITSYTVTATDITNSADGGQSGTTAETHLTVTGLTGGDSYTFAVTATNAAGTSPSSVSSNVVTIEAPTAITSPSTTSAGMRQPFDFKVTTTGVPAAAISENGALPTGVTFTDSGDGTADLAGSPAAGTAGTYPITITASNSLGSPAIQPFVLTVTSAQSAPAVTSSATDTETFGVPFDFTVNTTGYPAPKLTKSGTLPTGVIFIDNGDGTASITGVPSKSAVGTYPLTLTTKNSAGTSTQAFTLYVTKAPVINRIPDTTDPVGTALNLTVTAKGYTTPALTESGSLPTGITFTDNGNGTATLAGTPATGSGGAYAITVSATNQLGTTSQTFTLKITEPPAITSPGTITELVGTAFTFQITSTGYTPPKVTKVGTLPKGVTFTASTGIISGAPKPGTAGSYPISITAKNAAGTATQNFVLVIVTSITS